MTSLYLLLLLIYLVVAGIIQTIHWIQNANNPKETEVKPPSLSSRNALLDELKEMKQKGLATIDEAIEELSLKNSIYSSLQFNATQNLEIEDKKVNSELADKTYPFPEKPETENIVSSRKTLEKKKEHQDINSASVMLYVGSGLVVFAILSFVALGWRTFPDFVKILVVILLTSFFYLTGIVALAVERIRHAGRTLLAVGSVSLGLTGIGIWNFGLSKVFPGGFWVFWLFYSVFCTIVYVLTFYRTSLKNYRYLIVLAINSVMISLSFAFIDDVRSRIVVLAGLNLVLYILSHYMGVMKNLVSITSRVTNQVLYAFISLIIYFELSLSNWDGSRQFLALIALLIPTSFNILAYFKEKAGKSPEAFISIFSIPLSVILLGRIFDLTTDVICLILMVCLSILLFIKQAHFKERFEPLANVANFGIWAIILSELFLVLYSWLEPFQSPFFISIPIQIVVLVMAGILLGLLTIIEKHWKALAFPLALIPVLILRIMTNFPPIHEFTYSIVQLGLFFATPGILWSLSKDKPYKNVGWLFGLVSSSFAVGYAVESGFWQTSLVLGILSLVLFAASRLRDRPVFAYFVPFLLLGSVFNFLVHAFNTRLFTGEFNLVVNVILLVCTGIYVILSLAEDKKPIQPSNYLGLGIFSLAAFLTANSSSFEHGITVYGMLLTFYLILTWWLKKEIFAWVSFGLAYFFLNSIFNRFRIPDSVELLFYAIIGSILVLVSYGQNFISPKVAKTISIQALISNFGVGLLVVGSVISNSTVIHSLTLCILAVNIFFSKNPNKFEQHTLGFTQNWFGQYLSGFGLVLAAWNFFGSSNLGNAQWYVIPLTIYLLGLAYWLHYQGKKEGLRSLEIIAYIWQGLSLLGQSAPSSFDAVLWGLVLIVLSSSLIVFASVRKNKPLLILGWVFLILELLIRLWFVFLAVPWWIYILLIGLGLIAGSIIWLLRKK